jgi:hypothetical protein
MPHVGPLCPHARIHPPRFCGLHHRQPSIATLNSSFARAGNNSTTSVCDQLARSFRGRVAKRRLSAPAPACRHCTLARFSPARLSALSADILDAPRAQRTSEGATRGRAQLTHFPPHQSHYSALLFIFSASFLSFLLPPPLIIVSQPSHMNGSQRPFRMEHS